MKAWRPVFLVLALAIPACTTKKSAQAKAQTAFMAGRLQAMAQAAAQTQSLAQPESQAVFVQGQVRNPTVPWTEDLTLAQAIVVAEYLNLQQPREIVLHRQGQLFRINPRRLLVGQDNPLLEPGDIIELRR